MFVTHDLNEAMRMGDRIMIMRNGKVVQLGTAQEILNTPADDYVSEFISDVDRSRVLTAGTIMQAPLVTATERDDPEDVLRRLSNVEGVGAYVLDDDGRIVGVTRADLLAAAVGQHRAALGQLVTNEYKAVGADTPLSRHLFARRPQQRAAGASPMPTGGWSASFRARPCSPRSPHPARRQPRREKDGNA